MMYLLPLLRRARRGDTDGCATAGTGYPTALENLGPGEPGLGKCSHADLVVNLPPGVPVNMGYHFFYQAQADPNGPVTKYRPCR